MVYLYTNHGYYRNLENSYEDKNSLMSKKLKIVTEFLDGGNKFLDIGCGTGFLLDKIKDKYNKIFGIDISKDAVEFSNKKFRNIKNVFITQTNLEKFKGNSFDVCTALDVLEHLDNPEKALKKIYKMLKKDGKAIFTFPNFYDKFFIFLNTKIMRKDYLHKVSYSALGWGNLIKGAGFKIKYIRSVDFPVIHSDFLSRKFYFFGMCLLFVCEK